MVMEGMLEVMDIVIEDWDMDIVVGMAPFVMVAPLDAAFKLTMANCGE